MTRNDLWVNGLLGLKDKYEAALSTVDREGIPRVINYLRNTDFYMAPGSAKNHNNYKGGLVEHSLLVYENILGLAGVYPDIFNGSLPVVRESLTLVSLLHDVCKVNFYKETTRNKKVNGVWIQEPFYEIEDSLPLGHGEKSIIIIQRLLPLSTEEMMAIRWHMMGFDSSAQDYGGALALRGAAEKYPLLTLLHMADLAACYLEDPHVKHQKIAADEGDP